MILATQTDAEAKWKQWYY